MNRLLAIALFLLASTAAQPASCTVTTTGVAFGAYDSLAASPLDSSGTVSFSCDSAATLTVALGRGSSSSYLRRWLGSGLNVADYNLYLEASCSTVWGDGTEGTSTRTASGTSGSFPVFGRVPARQPLRVGGYADSIVVTIVF
jgi:spore coat protein U-like protein